MAKNQLTVYPNHRPNTIISVVVPGETESQTQSFNYLRLPVDKRPGTLQLRPIRSCVSRISGPLAAHRGLALRTLPPTFLSARGWLGYANLNMYNTRTPKKCTNFGF